MGLERLPEQRVIFDDEGHLEKVVERERYDSHRLIEEFMIAANVAAAETMAASSYPTAYRVHEPPDPERVFMLRESLQTLNIRIPHGASPKPGDFNRVIINVRGTPQEHMINSLVLRTQSQAVYSPENKGHLGLALRQYVHFTSPIRRYSDLLVHRGLIAACKLGDGGWPGGRNPNLVPPCEHISMTERRAATAERQTVDRFTASYLADRVGANFQGRVNGVSRFGIFVTLDETGADGILPMRHLPQDFYDVDEAAHMVIGRRHGLKLRVGDTIKVRLFETDEIAGSIVFEHAGVPAGSNRRETAENRPRKGRPNPRSDPGRAGLRRQ